MTTEKIAISGVMAFIATILIGFSMTKVTNKEKIKFKPLADYLKDQESDNNDANGSTAKDGIEAVLFGKEEIYTALGFQEVSDLFIKVNTIATENDDGEFIIEPKNQLHYKVTVVGDVINITKLDGVDMPIRTIIVNISDLNEVVQEFIDGSQACTDILI